MAGVESSSPPAWSPECHLPHFPLPISYKDKIRQIEGSGPFLWHLVRRRLQGRKEFLSQSGVGSPEFMEIYPEFILSDENCGPSSRIVKASVAGRKLITRFKWKIGDTVTSMGLIFPGTGFCSAECLQGT